MSGCLDCSIRIWSIPQKAVIFSTQTTDYITAGTFTPSGDSAVIGLAHGQCMIFDYDKEDPKLRFLTQINCRNRRGVFSKGKKVTGIEFLDDTHFIVTTNDSRIRLYNISSYNLLQKYKGLKNTQNPLRASITQDGLYLICGSENGQVYIWNKFQSQTCKQKSSRKQSINIKNNSFEVFKVSGKADIVNACFAPESIIKLAQQKLLQDGARHTVNRIILTTTSDARLQVYYNNLEI